MKKVMMAVLITWCFTLFPADSIKVYWGMVDRNGVEFTPVELNNLKFKAWISNYGEDYTSNVTTELDSANMLLHYGDIRGTCVIDFNNFPDWQWRSGDVFHLLIKDYNWFKDESYYEAIAYWSIPENAEGLHEFGFEDYFGYGGYPIISWIPYAVITDVYINCINYNGDKFDFSSFPYDNIVFRCWITGRESEVIDQNSSGSRFIDFTSTSSLKINRGNFQTGWESGDTLNVRIKQWVPEQGYYTGEKKFVFYTTHSFSHYGPYDIRFGLGECEGDNPVKADVWVEDAGIEDSGNLPEADELHQNYPNPFNPVTQIKFALKKTADVRLSVYNIAGQKVAELANGTRNAGYHTVNFDGSRLNSGIYYYTLEVDGMKITKKMLLTK
jgi:hypothetical protein